MVGVSTAKGPRLYDKAPAMSFGARLVGAEAGGDVGLGGADGRGGHGGGLGGAALDHAVGELRRDSKRCGLQHELKGALILTRLKIM